MATDSCIFRSNQWIVRRMTDLSDSGFTEQNFNSDSRVFILIWLTAELNWFNQGMFSLSTPECI